MAAATKSRKATPKAGKTMGSKATGTGKRTIKGAPTAPKKPGRKPAIST